MEKIAEELHAIVTKYSHAIAGISEAEFSHRPLPTKWSRKEVLGHLIDSGHNNLRRFVCGQYETTPPHIIYEQDFWVKTNGYQHATAENVLALWELVNLQIIAVLRTMPAAHYSRTCNTGRQSDELHSLQWLAADYVKHLKHHINQIIPGSFDSKYP